MFQCSALQKPDKEHNFFPTGQDTNLEMWRCLFKHTELLPLARQMQDLFMVHSSGSFTWWTALTERMLRKRSSPAVFRTSLFLYVQSKTTSPSTCTGPLQQQLLCSPTPAFLSHVSMSPASPDTHLTPLLSCLILTLLWKPFFSSGQSSLLLCYPTSVDIINLVPLAAGSSDTESWIPQRGSEMQRRNPGGWKGEIRLQQTATYTWLWDPSVNVPQCRPPAPGSWVKLSRAQKPRVQGVSLLLQHSLQWYKHLDNEVVTDGRRN